MTELEREVIQQVLESGGKVPPRTFVGRGYVVSWCVRRGWLDWERASTRTMKATALFITEAGRDAIQANAGSVR